ncbi:MAG TPA: IclR family transcriptional regulator C-terminal domain-containing protein, partial [Beijerinckiaceae bacterium]
RKLPPVTPQTPATLAALRELLDADRARGYGVSQSFFERGVSAVAAPVRDAFGRVAAAVNVTAVDTHIDLATMHGAIKDAVLRAAHDIGQCLASPPEGVKREPRRSYAERSAG